MSYKDSTLVRENRLIRVYTTMEEFQALNLGNVCKGDVLYREDVHTVTMKVKAKCVKNWLKGYGHSDERGYTKFIDPYALVDMVDVQTITEWKKDNDDSIERLYGVYELLEKTCNELEYLYNKHYTCDTGTVKGVKNIQEQVRKHIERKEQDNQLL